MRMTNRGEKGLLLGAVHNGDFAEASLYVEVGQTIEVSDMRLKCYAPADVKDLRPATEAPTKSLAKTPAPARKPVPDEGEQESASLAALLTAANSRE